MYFNLLKLLKKVQNQAHCPVCKRRFSLKDIKIKYLLDDIVVLHLSCAQGHDPVKTIHVVIFDKNNSSQGLNKQEKYISIHDKKIINKQIKEFDGDFIKLWKK